jgi:hypothetical protein
VRPRVPLALLVAALLAAGCSGPADPYAREPDQVSADEWTLEPGSFYLPSFETDGASHVRATVRVLSGEPVDAFLAAGAECNDYPMPAAFTPSATLLSSENGTLEADLPAGRACLALDNHDFPPGTSPGNGTVRVAYRIEVWRA